MYFHVVTYRSLHTLNTVVHIKTEHTDQTMRRVVGCKRVKTTDNRHLKKVLAIANE